jgi:outer membrane protein TolC
MDQQLADPLILRQYLDFVRASSLAYYQWMAAGMRLSLAEDLLGLAKKRDSAIAEQVKRGASAPIVQVDNQRLVVSREIGVVQARRRFEAAGIELSLFWRDAQSGEPRIAGRDRLPRAFPDHQRPEGSQLSADVAKAMVQRPELRRLELSLQKLDVERRLALNQRLPNLDLGVQGAQSLSDNSKEQKIDRTEVEARLEFRLPLQRREASGRLQQAISGIARLQQEQRFARDRIAAEVRDSYSALLAADDSLRQSRLNVELARQLERAEGDRLAQGATDLLALQIREQATFDAQSLEVEATADFFRALAHYRAAMAADAPPNLLSGPRR